MCNNACRAQQTARGGRPIDDNQRARQRLSRKWGRCDFYTHTHAHPHTFDITHDFRAERSRLVTLLRSLQVGGPPIDIKLSDLFVRLVDFFPDLKNYFFPVTDEREEDVVAA